MDKIYLRDLIIEVTRKCNFSCAHCMRGNSEYIDIDLAYIKEILSQIDFICYLTFTGGEPTLNLNAIRATLQYCKEFKIPVLNTCIVTNGTNASDEFLEIAKEWYDYCSLFIKQPMNYGGTQISQDIFHAPIPKENIQKILTLPNSGLKKNDYPNELINMGRAKNLTGMKRKIADNLRPLKISKYKNIYYVHKEGSYCNEVYLTAKGNIIMTSTYEYDLEDMYKICDYKSFSQYVKDNAIIVNSFNYAKEHELDNWVYID